MSVNGWLRIDYYIDEKTKNPMAVFDLEMFNSETIRTGIIRHIQLAWFDDMDKDPYWLWTIQAAPNGGALQCKFAAATFAHDNITMQAF